MKRSQLVGLGLALAVVLPACGGAAAAQHPSKAELGKQYLKIANGSNTKMTDAFELLMAGNNVPEYRHDLASMAKIDSDFAHDLLAIDFPSSMKDDVNRLVTVVNQESAAFQDASADFTGFTYLQAQLQALSGKQVSAADILRHDLGLSPSKALHLSS